MTEHLLYLPTIVPQWGIFIGFALVIIGYVDKKERWAYAGWGVLVATGIAALYFNLFGGFAPQVGELVSEEAAHLFTSGWLTAIGGVLALASMVFLYFKLKRYSILAILTLIYFGIVFFQYNNLNSGKIESKPEKTEQTNP